MELWIRSQGKRKLVKIDNVLLKGIDTRLVIANYKGSNIADESYFLLGEYKSTERALEVLDEIESLLNDETVETEIRYVDNQEYERILKQFTKCQRIRY